MGKVKITDAEIKACVGSGMSAAEIAEKYGINKNYVYIKIRRIKEQDNKQESGIDVKLMDTVVRKSDRKRFRVTEIDEKSVVLKDVTGEYGHAPKDAITVCMNEFVKNFEKKNYPEVKIYKMDEQLGKTINKEPQEASIKDSGERKTFHTGAVRDVQGGKGRCDLLPACAILRLARHYEAGAEKYEERNWEKGIPIHSFLDSALRHILRYLDGQMDEDHLCAAAWNLMGTMWTEEKRPELQDIPSRLGEKEGERSANLLHENQRHARGIVQTHPLDDQRI